MEPTRERKKVYDLVDQPVTGQTREVCLEPSSATLSEQPAPLWIVNEAFVERRCRFY
ncbi:MAG: hypothetical protein H6729_16660 [Deltaproteobacteria bacterium]|nr:hypothetical protein [Deltaproteobacteria bacterium]